jgi:hypothetical protein
MFVKSFFFFRDVCSLFVYPFTHFFLYLTCCFALQYDANSNGLLSASELQALLHEVGAKVSDTQFALFQEEMDLNRDGRIGRGEFIHAVAANRRHLENAANPRENNSVFGKLANMPDKAPVGPTEADRQYDADAKQAALAAVAWRRVLSFLAAHPEKAEQLEGLFGSADEDGGGTLTVHEVCTLASEVRF